ncbi:hypothetical protein GLU01_00590 [Nanohaloarchaea archaeon]|nr:hypothetical protein [Candidatus Nanohaloarchaea archaeon]
MEVEVKPSGDTQLLVDNLSRRIDGAERKNGLIVVETDNPQDLSTIPGVEWYEPRDGQRQSGVGGSCIGEDSAFKRVENRRDAAEALAATLDGFSLVVRTERRWDLKCLKRFNPDIKNLKSGDPESLGLQKLEHTGFSPPEQEEVEDLYRLLQP